MFQKIPHSKRWTRIEPVNKGFSGDKKYHIWDADGTEFLLRISPIDHYGKKKEQFALLQQIHTLNIPASKPIELGILDENHIYLLLTWLAGEDAETYLSRVDDKTAYQLGLQGGHILNELQKICIEPPAQAWNDQFQPKIDQHIEEFNSCPVELQHKELVLQYVQSHRNIIQDRPTVFMHGDYHRGNMIVAPDGTLGIIDFDRVKSGDSYRDFKAYTWNVYSSSYFASGIIDGYFDHKIPNDFFPILAFYTAEGMMHFMTWAIPFGDKEIQVAKQNYHNQLRWFDNFKRTIPTWYVGDGMKY